MLKNLMWSKLFTFVIFLSTYISTPAFAQTDDVPNCGKEIDSQETSLQELPSRIYSGFKNLHLLKLELESSGPVLAQIDRSTVGDHFPDLQPISICKKIVTSYLETFKPSPGSKDSAELDQSRSLSNLSYIFTYDIPISNSEFHVIRVAIPIQNDYSHNTSEGLSLDGLAKHTVKVLPLATLKATHLIKYTGYTSKNGFNNAHTDGDVITISVAPPGMLNYGNVFRHMIVHEHGHTVANFFSSNYYPPFWSSRVSLDANKYISTYAKNNLMEDFAETFTYFVDSSEDNFETYKEHYPHRWRELELLFAADKGGIRKSSFWDILSAYSIFRPF